MLKCSVSLLNWVSDLYLKSETEQCALDSSAMSSSLGKDRLGIRLILLCLAYGSVAFPSPVPTGADPVRVTPSTVLMEVPTRLVFELSSPSSVALETAAVVCKVSSQGNVFVRQVRKQQQLRDKLETPVVLLPSSPTLPNTARLLAFCPPNPSWSID